MQFDPQWHDIFLHNESSSCADLTSARAQVRMIVRLFNH
jgi:hypothetical protein